MVEPSVHALSIRNLTKSFGGSPVVKGLNLEVRPGEIFGLLGPNGAGKSTIINLVTGVCRMESGTVEIFGHDNRREFTFTRRLTGVVHQEIVIDPFFTVGEALRLHSGYFGVKDDPRWRETLLERLALKDQVDKKMNRLSGGMKRRFMIAKAMIHRPKLLILDEPTAGVDVELRKALWEFVREIRADGTTILLTTHYLEEAEVMCDRVAILNKGGLVALDTTRNLMSRLDKRRLKVRLREPTALPESLRRWSPEEEEGGRALEFRLTDPRQAGELLAALLGSGLPVTEVETREASLEDVFLDLTGRSSEHAAR